MHFRRSALLLSFVVFVIAQVPAAGSRERASDLPVVAVSILPQSYFVERISGGTVRSLVIVGAGQSPHSYEPTPRQLADLAQASAWFTVGVEFEHALEPKIAGSIRSSRSWIRRPRFVIARWRRIAMTTMIMMTSTTMITRPTRAATPISGSAATA